MFFLQHLHYFCLKKLQNIFVHSGVGIIITILFILNKLRHILNNTSKIIRISGVCFNIHSKQKQHDNGFQQLLCCSNLSLHVFFCLFLLWIHQSWMFNCKKYFVHTFLLETLPVLSIFSDSRDLFKRFFFL